ncbi:MAG: putative transporter [bacterium ADurb.Bin243]|nr:MAG: putative transporter [bacterium ADurb.Bin243]
MLYDFMASVAKEPVFVTFLILFTGLTLAKFKIKGVSAGSAAIFMTGFIFGIYGLRSSEHITALGLMIFMYAIGIHSGPSFFNSLGKKGLPYLIIAISVSFSTIFFTVIAAKLFGFSTQTALGLFTGSLNSSSSVAILYDSGWGHAMLSCYGIVYPLGLLSVVFFVQLLPAALKKNLIREARRSGYKKKEEHHYIIRRKFKVKNEEVIGLKVHELSLDEKLGVHVARLYRGDLTMTIVDNIRLIKNDVLLLVGEEKPIEKAGTLIGREVIDDLSVDPLVESRQIIINNPALHNSQLESVDFLNKYHAIVNKIWRNGIELAPKGNFTFEKGDTLTVLGNPKNLDKLEGFLGTKKAMTGEFDLSSISFGMALAFVLSKLKLSVPHLGTFTLGVSGSALLIGMVFGYLTYLGILKRNMSTPAESILKELGLGLFLAGIGTRSGAGICDLNLAEISALLFSSLMIMYASMIFVFSVCSFVLKMNFVKSLACVCGGFNSTTAITTLTSIIGSEEPVSFFASAYPLSLFGIIFSSQVLAVIMHP